MDVSVVNQPTCYVIAEPNGAGKTTFALRYQRTVSNFLNIFAPLCNEVFCYDNSGLEHVMVFADTDGNRKIVDRGRYKLILESCDE